jgi:acylphosphatase
MYHALEKHLQCQVYSTGMYKGINGFVESIHNGTVVIAGETEEGTPVKHVFRLSDIKRVSVFDR